MIKNINSGILLVNKPKDLSSFAVVKWARKMLGTKKIGHLGTLDPFATGVLPLVFGRATRLSRYLIEEDKKYLLKLAMGIATDTMDKEGRIIESAPLTAEKIKELTADGEYLLRTAVEKLVGEHLQKPPPYSAVKIDGKPLYHYARRGEKVEAQARRIKIYEAVYLGIDQDYSDPFGQDASLFFDLSIHSSKGSYMRVLADELGRSLGSLAYAAELERVQLGSFAIEQAVEIAEVERIFFAKAFADSGRLREILLTKGHILSSAEAAVNFPGCQLNDDLAVRIASGQKIDKNEIIKNDSSDSLNDSDCTANNISAENLLALYWQDELLAMARIGPEGLIKPETVFFSRDEFIKKL